MDVMDTLADAPRAPLLEVKDLRTYFFTRWGTGKAVDGVSFSLGERESLGLLGESGCGKSMTSLSILRLVPRPAGRIVGGEVLFQGRDLLRLSEEDMRRVRGRQIAMILQDPLSTLNPVFSIGDQVAEPLRVHRIVPRSGIRERVAKLLSLVRIPAPESRLKDYPHQFSGGMRQRVVGATAISAGPKVLIADEPTTSLDVTIQAQYLRLLKDIQNESNLSILYITHDLGTLARICDRVAVMYAGKIVEQLTVEDLFERPAHPYTEALLQSVPRMDRKVHRFPSIEGSPPLVHALPPGCAFAPRCPRAQDVCRREFPPVTKLDNGHSVACWLHAKDPHDSALAGSQERP